MKKFFSFVIVAIAAILTFACVDESRFADSNSDNQSGLSVMLTKDYTWPVD